MRISESPEGEIPAVVYRPSAYCSWAWEWRPPPRPQPPIGSQRASVGLLGFNTIPEDKEFQEVTMNCPKGVIDTI